MNSERLIAHAVTALNSDGCLIYPTETFYALGASILSKQAIERISRIKLRPREKPLPLIIGSWQQIFQITEVISPELKLLAYNFWPGPLSILVPAKDWLHYCLKDGLGNVCLRLTSHPIATRLCQSLGTALISTSANKTGCPEVNRSSQIDADLRTYVDSVIDLPPQPKGGLPSTIVDIVHSKVVRIIRPGAISMGKIRNLGLNVQTDLTITGKDV